MVGRGWGTVFPQGEIPAGAGMTVEKPGMMVEIRGMTAENPGMTVEGTGMASGDKPSDRAGGSGQAGDGGCRLFSPGGMGDGRGRGGHKYGRGEWIRTTDLHVPNVAR